MVFLPCSSRAKVALLFLLTDATLTSAVQASPQVQIFTFTSEDETPVVSFESIPSFSTLYESIFRSMEGVLREDPFATDAEVQPQPGENDPFYDGFFPSLFDGARSLEFPSFSSFVRFETPDHNSDVPCSHHDTQQGYLRVSDISEAVPEAREYHHNHHSHHHHHHDDEDRHLLSRFQERVSKVMQAAKSTFQDDKGEDTIANNLFHLAIFLVTFVATFWCLMSCYLSRNKRCSTAVEPVDLSDMGYVAMDDIDEQADTKEMGANVQA